MSIRTPARLLVPSVLLVVAAVIWPVNSRAAAPLPDRLPDADFWRLTQDLSEPNGYFRSDNLVSDEMVFHGVVPDLRRVVKAGGVYLGVGPEQNFTYIAATRPAMAFILDIRRGNLHLQLMYKALFELSVDRADLISRLFTKPRPGGLTAASTVAQIMDAYWNVPTSDAATYQRNLNDIYDVLTKRHGFQLSQEDRDGIAYVYHAFYYYGPSIRWGTTLSTGDRASPTFADLSKQGDGAGNALSFLANEITFSAVRSLEERNLVVPVVGNFAGPKALRAIGSYIRDHQATVSAFYLSEVEPYLQQDGIWGDFCRNAATLPVDAASVFIRPMGVLPSGDKFTPGGSHALASIATDVKGCR